MLLRWRDAKIFTLWREISKLLGVSRLVSSVSLQAPSHHIPIKLTTEKPYIHHSFAGC
jgi:hypothetical protein